MPASAYQRLLGLPPEVVAAPDYYQMLGLERGWIDPAKISQTIGARLDHLAQADPSERDFVEHLKRELQRARAVLTDPARRSEYEEQLNERRLEEVKRYVQQLVVNGALPGAAEQAIIKEMAMLGLEAEVVTPAIEQQLSALGASRAGDAADDEAVQSADAQLQEVMAQVADELLREAIHLPAVKVPGRSAPAPAPAAAPAAAQERGTSRRERGTARREGPSGPVVVPPSPGPVMAPVSEAPPPPSAEAPPPPPAEAPPPRPPTQRSTRRITSRVVAPPPARPAEQFQAQEGRKAVQITELNEKITALEKEKARLTQLATRWEPQRRSARRWVRCFASLLLVAIAFAGGDLLATFLPEQVGKLDAQTADVRARILEQQTPAAIAGIIGGACAVLYLIVVWLAGREGKIPFLIPTIPLMLVGLAAGALPIGHERALEEERASLQAQVKATGAERDEARAKTTGAEEQMRQRDARIAELQKESDDLKKQVEARDGEIKKRDEQIQGLNTEAANLRRAVDEQAGLKAQVAERDQKIADLGKKIVDLDKQIISLKADKSRLEDQVKALKKEIDALKKEIEELKKKLNEKKQP